MNDPIVWRERGLNQRWRHVITSGGNTRLIVPGRHGGESFVTTVYGHEYETSTGQYLITNVDCDQALSELRALADNRSIRGRLMWREVSIGVSKWRAV